jgi:hypothetical protein
LFLVPAETVSILVVSRTAGTIAIAVYAIAAHIDRSGVDIERIVVAVTTRHGETSGAWADKSRQRRAEAVSVLVYKLLLPVESIGIDHAITVVVDAIADLVGIGV